MNLYHVMNGWKMHDSVVFVTVIAPNEDKALEIAREYYKEASEDWDRGPDYYKNLEVELSEEDILNSSGMVVAVNE